VLADQNHLLEVVGDAAPQHDAAHRKVVLAHPAVA
jgi:hypothetical protein